MIWEYCEGFFVIIIGLTLMYSDPISDMLTRVRNAQRAGHLEVSVPLSKLKVEIAKILVRQGFVKEYRLESDRHFVVVLKYDHKSGEPVIRCLKKVSKSGLRVYSRTDRLPRVLGGSGIAIISTSRGILTDHEARKLGVGGEVLCYVY
ncbi:MAG: 30S ribosomal protein S8 [Vampirovibrionales bacterium]|jgi:small subunit ribosomal protein S8|nr:30S ribosomal protein S8 [Vampirovibrionales bacterium]